MKENLEVRPCRSCGEPCEWCVEANRMRKMFTSAPSHDAYHDNPEEHHCVECFMLIAEVIHCTH